MVNFLYTFLASQDPKGTLGEEPHRLQFPDVLRYILVAIFSFALGIMLIPLLRFTGSPALLGESVMALVHIPSQMA